MKIGDRVEVIDDLIVGTVINIAADQVVIATDEGFEMTYQAHELIPSKPLNLTSTNPEQVIREKKMGLQSDKRKPSKKRRKAPPMEVDLHIHELTASTRNMSNSEMLNLQLNTARDKLDFAIKKHIQRVIFIHGIGEGVLKRELQTLFRRYDQIRYYDANYRDYGGGATEVYIYQNP